MKSKFFVTAALLMGLFAFGALAGPASAQWRGYRNFGTRIYTPQVNVYRYSPYYAPYSGYAPYSYPTGGSFGYASPYSGYSSYVSPYGGGTYSGYVANSYPRWLTPYGPVPASYSTYSGYWTPSGYGAAYGPYSYYGW